MQGWRHGDMETRRRLAHCLHPLQISYQSTLREPMSMHGPESTALPPLRDSLKSSWGFRRSLDIALEATELEATLEALETSSDGDDGRSERVSKLLGSRTLDHHWSGLFQYGTIRHGVERATELLAEVERQCETWVGPQRHAPQGLGGHQEAIGRGARLYRVLHELGRDTPSKRLRADANQWWKPPNDDLARKLVNLRKTLSEGEADILELCFARGLSQEEAAHVLRLTPQELETRYLSALATADRVLGPPTALHSRASSLLQSFALDPRMAPTPRRASAPPVLEIGAVVNGRYEIQSLLGGGAFSDVYRVRDLEVTDHIVSLKILRQPAVDSQAVRSALRELQLIASVFHPSIVQFKDHGWHDGHLWFVMPLYRGETLARRLRRGSLSRKEAREIFEPLAEALATMHRAGVRHQDIKPENVFLADLDPEASRRASAKGDAQTSYFGWDTKDAKDETQQKRVLPVLLDLGLAVKDAELVLAGTPAYLSPEVAARFAGLPDPPPIGPKSDIFSLALTLRQALDSSPLEEVPGGAVDAFVALRARMAPRAPKRSDLSDLRPAFDRWLNLSPEVRPTAEEFRRELSLLTRREERRKRRIELVRWLAPTTIAIMTLFATTAFMLSHEADLQRMEAESERVQKGQAQARAAAMHASLEEEKNRRQALEEEFLDSRLTRDQLAQRLAAMQADLSTQLARVNEEQDKLRVEAERGDALLHEQEALSTKLSEAKTRQLEASRALQAETARRTDAETRAGLLERRLQAAEQAVAEVHDRLNKMLSTTDSPEPTLSSNRGIPSATVASPMPAPIPQLGDGG